MTNKTLSIYFICALLTGCSTAPKLLPGGGPTTSQLWNGGEVTESNAHAQKSYQENDYYPRMGVAVNVAVPQDAMSSQSYRDIQALNTDFKRYPNPQVFGYVAPHFNQSNMPVPGYFTTFMLYQKDGFALINESAATGISQ